MRGCPAVALVQMVTWRLGGGKRGDPGNQFALMVAMVPRVTQGHSGRPLAMFGLAWAALRAEDAAILQIAAGAFRLGLAPWLARNALVFSRPRIDGRPG